jgi:ABC-type multidrug transport system fused ATPase/permease subunit
VALIQFWLAMPLALYGTLAILLLAYVGRYIPLGVRAANSSLRQIDPSLEESAQILGASWLTTMREVTLPLIRPGLFAGWLLVFVPVIQELSASILLFSSSSITLAVAVYNLYETGYIEPVAALAIINMIIIGAASWSPTSSAAARSRAAPESVKDWRRNGEYLHQGSDQELQRGDDAPAAVSDLSLEIADNSFVTLLGPSGCGKTTTLRMIAGYIVPDAGSIHVNGRLISAPGNVVPPDQRGMGMVFQNYAVWPHKTVYENVVFGLKVRKTPSAEREEAGRGRARRWSI